jgi:transcriptional regulator with XRE-family HTH domain
MTPAEHKALVARNLRNVLAAIDQPAAHVAARIGVSKSKFGNWLRGDNYPDPYAMVSLCDHYGVTMEYLYRGRIYGLPAELAVGLAAADAA